MIGVRCAIDQPIRPVPCGSVRSIRRGAAGPCTVRNRIEPSDSTSAIEPAPPPSTAIACARMRDSRSSRSSACDMLLLDLEQRVELALAALEIAPRVQQLLVLRDQRLVQPRVLDRDRGLAGERARELLVAELERAALLVEELEHADEPAQRAEHRDGQDRARAIAALEIDRRLEALVGVGVGDVERLAGLRDPARDALADREPDLDDLAALRSPCWSARRRPRSRGTASSDRPPSAR